MRGPVRVQHHVTSHLRVPLHSCQGCGNDGMALGGKMLCRAWLLSGGAIMQKCEMYNGGAADLCAFEPLLGSANTFAAIVIGLLRPAS